MKLLKVVAPVIGEVFGLVPDFMALRKLHGVEKWNPRFRFPSGYEVYDVDILEKELELMHGFFEDLKRHGACPSCDPHIANLERELQYLSEKMPSYMKAERLRRELAEFLEKFKKEKPEIQA